MPAAMSLVLVVMYGLRPFVKQPPGHSHPMLGPQKTIGWLTVLAGWTAMFLGCAVLHYSWVSADCLCASPQVAALLVRCCW
jgi:hypothetical protein